MVPGSDKDMHYTFAKLLNNYDGNDEGWLPQSAEGRDAEESFVVFGESNFTASKPSSQKYNKCKNHIRNIDI